MASSAGASKPPQQTYQHIATAVKIGERLAAREGPHLTDEQLALSVGVAMRFARYRAPGLTDQQIGLAIRVGERMGRSPGPQLTDEQKIALAVKVSKRLARTRRSQLTDRQIKFAAGVAMRVARTPAREFTDDERALAVKVAKRTAYLRGKSHLEDEFIREAAMLLYSAWLSYDPTRGPFEQFAWKKIENGLRDWDDAQSGRTRLQAISVKAARAEEIIIVQREHRTPTASEISAEMTMSELNLAQVLDSAHALEIEGTSQKDLPAAVANRTGHAVPRVKRILDLHKEMEREQERNHKPKAVTAADVARRLKAQAEAYKNSRREEIPIEGDERSHVLNSLHFAQAPKQENEILAKELLSKIPERYRTSVLLVVSRESSYEDASAELGVPVGTVKSHVSRGLKMLRQLCKEK